MSGFTIPNTPDATNQNQAEPDSLDFQILGKQVNGVVSGMTVTPGSGQTVSVASGEVLIGGSYYSYTSTTVSLTNYASSNFFDVIIARLDSGVITCYAIPGTSGTNPRFPSTGTTGSSSVISHTTDVVLATVWRTSGSAPLVGEITDKRIFVRSNANRVGATATGGNHADLWVQPTTWTPSSTLESPVSVNVNGTWYKLARYDASGNFTAGTVTATTFIGNLQGSITGNAATVTNGVYNNGGTYSINITGSSSYAPRSGYLDTSYNTDPLGGNHIGWSNANNGFFVIGNMFFGSNIYYSIPQSNTSSSTKALVINVDGRVAFNTLSSLRSHKEQIEDMTNGLELVKNLRPRTFIFKENYTDMGNPYEVFSRREQLQYGFIVEEVEEVNPDFIQHEETTNGHVPQMWKHHAVIAALVKAVQELSEKVESLENAG
jgi:hypothetical protein